MTYHFFGKVVSFLDLFFMLITHLQLLFGSSKAVEVPLPLCGVNIKLNNNCCLYGLLCFNALFLTQPPFPFASIFNNDIGTLWHFVLLVFYKCD